MRSLNEPGATVTHVALGGRYPDTPLCGFSADDEIVTGEAAEVTCLDCLAAMGA